jgi:50S ribosomal protein L16 3-hydroxylase
MKSAKRSLLVNLAGNQAARFGAGEWPADPMVFRSDPEWFERIAALDVVRDPEQWLDRAPSLTSFRTPGPLARSDARRRYAGGESIYILGLDQAVPALRALCHALAEDLDVAASSVNVEAWAAGAPTSVEMHFDHDFNFNVQIQGGKQWRTAPNRSVLHPIESHHVGTDKIIKASGEPSPTRMPDDAQLWQVEPGDVVYLPQGVWHATETKGPTFALAFVVKPRTWGQHMGSALAERLHKEPRWRARVFGTREPARAAGMRATASDAIAASTAALATIAPAELVHIAAWGLPDSFERAEGVADVRLQAREDGGRLTWQQGEEQRKLAVPDWARPAVEFIVGSTSPWSIGTIHELGRPGDELFLNVLVVQMVEAGLLGKVAR